MPYINEEEYQDYLEFKNKQLNDQLRNAVATHRYDIVKELISNQKLKPIDDKMCELIFDKSILRDLCRKDYLHDIIDFFMKYVSRNFLYHNYFGYYLQECVYRRFVSLSLQGVLPCLLKAISNSERYDISIDFINVIYLKVALDEENGPNRIHLEKALEAIDKYCTRLIDDYNSSYDVDPHYLLSIKDAPNFKEFKQYFKDIYSAINSDDLDKVKSSLEKIKTSVSEYKVDISSVAQALCCLVKKAGFNQDIGHAISDAQADITFPIYLENTSISSGTNKEFQFSILKQA
ncbi:hypothetical protein [Candidatus Mesenet endosymbiont of Agriotes lineatus]|uniref:hypothetical protein n=1 Tax=Candidatus Mesenet endosymbiont of Agriotes lineatus TaxID=3077948 RepID=UPI0030D4789F